MTNNEIKLTLRTTSKMVNKMDKAHIKDLLKTLMNAQNDCALFHFIDIKKAVKKLLSDLSKSENVDKKLSTKQVKHIYAIMGDYNVYPTCKLCGEPIQIDTSNEKSDSQSKKMFTWDHLYPKSLGGQSSLDNMQAAHKICNNKKGDKVLYRKHYHININVQIDVCECDDGKYRPTHFGLRKQDSWCHKMRQYTR